MNKFWRTILEINDVSFTYYFGIYLILLILDIVKKDFVFRVLRFPLSWLMWFVIVSGVLKLFFNLDKLINWTQKFPSLWSKWLLKFFYCLKNVKDYSLYLFQKLLKNINSIFSYSLVLYLILLLIREFKDVNLIKKYLFFKNSPVEKIMNWLLGFVIITGIISVLTQKSEIQKRTKEKITFKDYIFIFSLGILGGFLIFYKTKELGWLSYVISSISSLLIILLSVIILKEEENES